MFPGQGDNLFRQLAGALRFNCRDWEAELPLCLLSACLTNKKLGRKRPSFKNSKAPSLRAKSVKKLETLYVYAHHRDIPKAG